MTPKQVIKHFGTVSEAARKLKVSRTIIYKWLETNVIPSRTQAFIQIRTNGKLRA